MNIKHITKIAGGQDGAIYGSELFRFDTRGNCSVYYLPELLDESSDYHKPIASFKLDRAEILAPHSNAVSFGTDFYQEGDAYPLLYTNVYNNYAKEDDKLIGVCLVYRILRNGNEFISTLVQMIEIAFCDDPALWKASPGRHGDRPYGNFVIDDETHSYWAFVMRNEEKGTRYFKFDLPSVHDGEIDARFNVRRVKLYKEDIKEYFDCGYHRFIQGATLHNGKIYSTEGFTNSKENRPAIRIIDLEEKNEQYFDITKLGFNEEPELIDFYNGICLYSDAYGNLYTVDY